MIDSNNNDTEVPEDVPEEQALQLKVKDFACRSKASAYEVSKKVIHLLRHSQKVQREDDGAIQF